VKTENCPAANHRVEHGKKVRVVGELGVDVKGILIKPILHRDRASGFQNFNAQLGRNLGSDAFHLYSHTL